jgi:creatinine amidohydrolase
MAFRRWQDLSTRAFAALDPARAFAVLPLAATEQHGPHLPTGTDFWIAEGLLAEAARLLPAEVDALVLPTLPVGASLEHTRFPGTLSLSAAQLTDQIVAVGEGVKVSGLRKLLIVSSHGGNVAAMTAAALECRARHDLLAVTLTWSRLGLPAGLVEDREQAFGVHGGLIETALMLHFRPDLVDMSQASNASSLQEDLAGRFAKLRAYGPIGFGWLAGDLNPAGVTGDASAATAEIGAAIAAHQTRAFVELLAEVAGAELDATLKP